MTDRNALGDAYTTVAEVAGLLDTWSKRPAATVTATQRTELVKMLKSAHKALYQAERAFEAAALEAQEIAPASQRMAAIQEARRPRRSSRIEVRRG